MMINKKAKERFCPFAFFMERNDGFRSALVFFPLQ